MHTHLYAVHASSHTIEKERRQNQDMFMEEALSDLLVGAIDRAADGCLNAMIELEEMLGLSPDFSSLSLSDNAHARGFTELPETLNSRKPPTDQESQS
jgi:hypothetical protein